MYVLASCGGVCKHTPIRCGLGPADIMITVITGEAPGDLCSLDPVMGFFR